MFKPYRLLSLILLVVLGISLGEYVWTDIGGFELSRPTPEMLPAAFATPVDVAIEDTLRPGETLSSLLTRASLVQTESNALLDALKEHQDLRRMKPGAVIELRRSVRTGEIRRVELALDADRTLAMSRDGDGWASSIEEVPVQAETVVLSGTVRSSLYRALLDGTGSGIPAAEREQVADILADQIFAWQVDFSRDLRSGDRYRILYERLTRPDGTARSGRILSVQFNINNKDYEAYAFSSENGGDDYFNAEGESLRTAFLRAPLNYRRISSVFSRSRLHPILRTSRAHNGIDYAASAGTPVRAVGDGVIRRAGNSDGYGNLVEISHTRSYASRYGHLRGFASGIRPGVRVKQGDVIGYVGMTGLATGPHLHFEFHQNGRPIDPNTLRDIAGDPVPRSYRSQFLGVVQNYIASLDHGSPKVLVADLSSPGTAVAGD